MLKAYKSGYAIERAKPMKACSESGRTEDRGELTIPKEDERAGVNERNKARLCSSLTRM